MAANGTIRPARQARHLSLGICHSALDTQTRHTAHGPLAEPQQTMAEASASYMMHCAWGVGVGVGLDVGVGLAGRCLGLVGRRPSLELGARSLGLELGAWAWSLELGARSSELGALALALAWQHHSANLRFGNHHTIYNMQARLCRNGARVLQVLYHQPDGLSSRTVTAPGFIAGP